MRALTVITTLIVALLALFFFRKELATLHAMMPPDTLDWLADWLSLYGFVLSLFGIAASFYAAFSIREVQKRFASKARLPELSHALKIDADGLLRISTQAIGSPHEAIKVISALRSDLSAVHTHLPKSLRQSHKQASAKVKSLWKDVSKSSMTLEEISKTKQLWAAHSEVHVFNAELANYIKDQKWEV